MLGAAVGGVLPLRADAGVARFGELSFLLVQVGLEVLQARFVPHAVREEKERRRGQEKAEDDERDFLLAPDHSTGLAIDGR